MNLQQLIGLQRAEFAKASRLRGYIIGAQGLIAILAMLTVFFTSSQYAYLAGVGVAIVAVFWVFAWNEFRRSRAQAERARRATLLMAGLGGEEISAAELNDIEVSFTVSRDAGSKLEDPEYFTAVSPTGDSRLVEMLEQSAFFSCCLMRSSAYVSFALFAGFVIMALFALFASAPFIDAEQLLSAVRLFCIGLVFLVSIDALGTAISYSAAAQTLSSISSRLETVRARNFPRADLLLILSDYNSAVEGAPMFMPFLYQAKRNQLNDLWSKRLARTVVTDAPHH